MGTGSRTNANVTPSITTMDLMELVIKLASSALEHVADGFVDLFARWCGAGQPFDDCGRGLARNTMHLRDGRRSRGGNGLFRFGDATGELCVHFFATHLSGCRRLFVCFI